MIWIFLLLNWLLLISFITGEALIIPCPSNSSELATLKDVPLKSYHLAGLAADATDIKPKIFSYLLELSCIWKVGIHAQVGKGGPQALEWFREAQSRCFEDAVCGSVDFVLDPPGTKEKYPNRVDRIAFLRDYQRDNLRYKLDGNLPDVVIVSDLQMYDLPEMQALLQNIYMLVHDDDSDENSGEDSWPDNSEDEGDSSNDTSDEDSWSDNKNSNKKYDAICSAGLMHFPFGYYDIFATVWKSGTFAYPLSGRLIQEKDDAEDETWIRSAQVFGNVTQEDFYRRLREQGEMMEVRSCFGGLAVYRGPVWFREACRYSMKYSLDFERRFANSEDGRPCEHVIFHSCLSREDPSVVIAVDPFMTTLWDEPVTPPNFLFSGGQITHGLPDKTGLVTSKFRPELGLSLRNQQHILQIDHEGSLVIYSNNTVRWKVQSKSNGFHLTFLTLTEDGELLLTQQMNNSCHSSQPCRKVIWSSYQNSNDDSNNCNNDDSNNCNNDSRLGFILHLGKDGILRVVELSSQAIVWRSESSLKEDDSIAIGDILELRKSNQEECLASGNQDDINQALQGYFKTVELCRSAVFELKSPVIFTAPYQTLTTEGEDDKERAVLRIIGPDQATAVHMLDQDYAHLINVIVDGNRPNLGKVNETYGEALIRAGGECRGQEIRHVAAFEPRSWSTLHVAEGDPAHRCRGALVENNKLGPAGQHEQHSWSDGISMACQASIVRNNRILDATDVALVLFGAPGTIVENNSISAISHPLNAGITLVDFDPFDGDFRGSIVRNNVVRSDNATIGVGIAMGTGAWTCPDILVNQRLYGAAVLQNTVQGNHVRHGFAIDGVHNWTVMNNIDTANRFGQPETTCGGLQVAAPAAFQIDRYTSTGTFQHEFVQATLANVANANRKRDIKHRFQTIVERTYPRWRTLFPCHKGLYYVKIPKTASTTVAGLLRRVMTKHTSQYQCRYQGKHTPGSNYKQREEGSFLMTFVRRPKDRDISSFFYHLVAKHNIIPSQENFEKWCETNGDNFQFNYLRIDDNDTIQNIMHSYDFIGVSERMNESIVALAMILGLDIYDILYMNAKQYGYAFTSDANGSRKCVSLSNNSTLLQSQEPNETLPSQERKESLQLRHWEERNKIDQALYDSANRSLDKTIESLGRYRFETNLRIFQDTLDYVQKRCHAFVRFPCDNDGNLNLDTTNCYVGDEGCGHNCIDYVASHELPLLSSNHDEVSSYAENGKLQCIPSGNPHLIQKALSGPFTEAVLCPGAVFELKSPIIFTDVYQSLYTLGNPTNNKRAILRITSSSLVTAVIMTGADFAAISHVIIDGNRPNLGSSESYHKALIQAGGESKGQIIRHIKALEPRGWTMLHVAEGDPSNRCRAAVITNNSLGPAGNAQEVSGGIAMACTDSIVQHNIIIDVTDGGLTLFGAPGSTIENNSLIWNNRSATAGIVLVDYDPFDGNFRGTIVQRNSITAIGALLVTGIAMGSNAWNVDQRSSGKFLFGAIVRSNTLRGDGIQRGFVVDGVKDWTLVDNVDESTSNDSNRISLQINRVTSTGEFQKLDQNFQFPISLVWQMSFPNSGTTYSLDVAANISAISTATNYVTEAYGGSVPFASHPPNVGPFWHRDDLNHPTNGSIFTKTHCGGYGHRQLNGRLWISQPEFLQDCLSTMDAHGNKFHYDLSLVKSLVHLIRDPFDNIVSRFRFERMTVLERRSSLILPEEIILYPETPSGFRAFCHDKVDHPYWRRGFDSPVSNDLWQVLEKVPCHTDFLRYIHWHNHAFDVAQDLDMQSLVIYYEQYGTHWNETVTMLMTFLGQPIVQNPSKQFLSGKTYRHFYDDEEINTISFAFEKLGSDQTWKSVKHYFGGCSQITNDFMTRTPTLTPVGDANAILKGHANHPIKEPFESKVTILSNDSKGISNQYSKGTSNKDSRETPSSEPNKASSSTPPPECSYSNLRKAFAINKDVGKSTATSCWKAEDEIPLVPLDAIVSIQDMSLLGTGENGIVHKVSIRLSDSICTVALKTDKCRTSPHSDRQVSCLHPDAIRERNPNSGATDHAFSEWEFLGGLIFAASKKAGLDLSGLLPTWGLVRGSNDTDIVGAIMPIKDFKDLQSLAGRTGGHWRKAPRILAQLMLPVAEALSFVEKIGFSFQDIHTKNIGVSLQSEEAFVFDNTFITWLGRNTTLCQAEFGDACNFCINEQHSRRYRQVHHTPEMIKRRDCHNLIQAIISVHPAQETYAPSSKLFEQLDSLRLGNEECTMEGVMEALKNIDVCIPSGNEDSIKRELVGAFAEVILCPGATFNLSSPIIFRAPNQKVFTKGKPVGNDRAVLKIIDRNLNTAVFMRNYDNLELSHVIIDGNRPVLGKASEERFNEDALIKAGGQSKNQTIHHVKAYEPRGWSVLHLIQGLPSVPCRGAIIESNHLGPAGQELLGEASSGLAIACRESIVKENTITDVTLTAIVISATPGSTIEENTIVSQNQTTRFGISLVDYKPYRGDYRGTVVQRNTVEARNSLISAGIVMGSGISICVQDEDLVNRKLFGAVIRENVLTGNYMRYGFAVDGVKNWTVVDNSDNSKLVGEPIDASTCLKEGLSTPSSFLIDHATSTGEFQDDFEDGRLRNIAMVDEPVSKPDLHLVLLMSFPNSGTSYTLRVARKLSRVSFATNYAQEAIERKQRLYGTNVSGPFWVCCSSYYESICESNAPTEETPRSCRRCPFECREKGLILTKTHCGGDSHEWTSMSKQQFLQKCMTTSVEPGVNEKYSSSRVKRLVHLIRDPFDNVVSRFHHWRDTSFSEYEQLQYRKNAIGFRAFCRDKIDYGQPLRKDTSIDETLIETIENVPCHTDFLRYIAWHNNAFEATRDMAIPSLLIHFEHYITHWDETVNTLIDFLEQTVSAEDEFPFMPGKDYRDYYTTEEIDVISSVFQKMASEKTWSHICHYFEECDRPSVATPHFRNELTNIKPSERRSVQLHTRLPFILGPSLVNLLPSSTVVDRLSILSLENLNRIDKEILSKNSGGNSFVQDSYFYLNPDVMVNADGSLVAFSGSRNGSDERSLGKLRIRFASALNKDWVEREISLPANIGFFKDASAYIEQNRTVTMVLDTCTDTLDGERSSCFTIVEAENGCTIRNCNSWKIIANHVLEVPRNCSDNLLESSIECPCNLEHPTIWYDKPLRKWRMLLHQFPSQPVEGKCEPKPNDNKFAGGYAETVGESAAGPWVYDYFRPAYNYKRRKQDYKARIVAFTNQTLRVRPKVVLSRNGGLDGGYLVNTECKSGENFLNKNECGISYQPVSRSVTFPEHRTNGTIYLTYHAETRNPIYPLGIGEMGIDRSNYMATIFDGRRFKIPQTIIAGQVRDDMNRGQRLQGTVTKLALELGIDIIKGPLLRELPYWTYHSARVAALQALEALKNGPVVFSWWSYTMEFCEQLGLTTCENYEEMGEMMVIEIKDGEVVDMLRTTDGWAFNYEWKQLPPKVRVALEILQYNEDIWDKDTDQIERMPQWDSLSDAQRCAASELQYTEESWNAGAELPIDIVACGGTHLPFLKDSSAGPVYDTELLNVERCVKMLT